jgi:hypothetical protein
LKTLQKRNGKVIRKFRKKGKKPIWPKPAHQAQPRAPARLPPLTGGPRLSAPVCPAPFSLSHSLPSGAKLSAPVSFTRATLFPLCLAGLLCQTPSRCPVRSTTLSLCRGPPLSAPPSPRSPWTSARTHDVDGILGHDERPCAPAPFLSPARARTHPLPHFAQPHPLSRCAHTVRPRRRLAPASPVN